MTTNAELIERIDWENILKMSRYAGGHDEQMKGLLKDVEVITHWNEGDYQGEVATVVKLKDTKEIVAYTDYYGSCSGCDAWEDADDSSVKTMCIQLEMLNLRELLFKITELKVLYGDIPDRVLFSMIQKVKDKRGFVIGFKLKINIPKLIIKYNKKGEITGWEQK